MPLTLEYQAETSIPVEVEGVLPEVTRTRSLPEIEQLPVYHGNRTGVLADFFRVSGDPSDGEIDWRGNLAGVHWIGTKMTQGVMRVHGNAGRHVGSEMSGGEIQVWGNAGDWVGGEMHGGLIHIRGRAGHLIGAAYRGSPRGMTGGMILIDGDAGNEIGHSMRRGVIAIGGNAGDLAGFNLLAGTILFRGSVGIRHGAGMKRGTLIFLGAERPQLLPSFRAACRHRPEFISLLYRELRRHAFPLTDEEYAAEYDLFHGDLLAGGRGEVLLRTAAR